MSDDHLAPAPGPPVSLGRSRLLKVALLTLLAFAAAEVALQIRTRLRHSAPRFDYIVEDPELGRVLQPDVRRVRAPRERFGGEDRILTINRHGLRGADFAARPPAGTRRILCLGSSVVFGAESSDEELFTAQLQGLLGAVVRGPVEVLNAGVPGRSARAVQQTLEARDAGFAPETAVVYAIANDIGVALWELGVRDPTALPVARGGPRASHPLKRLWRSRSTVYVAGRVHFAWLRPATRTTEEITFPAEAAGLFRRDYRALVRSLKARGITPVLVTEPVAFRREQPYEEQLRLLSGGTWGLDLEGSYIAHESLNGAIRRVAEDEAVLLVDLARELPGGDAYFIDQIHLSVAGHRAVAERLAEALTRAGLLEPL